MASDIQDIQIFPGTGLDSDSDLLAIEQGDSRYRLNVILSEDGNYQVLANVEGNTLRNYSLPAGTNVIKGFVEDKENKAGIYFIHNSNNNHSIVRFNSEDNSFTSIISEQSVLLPAWPWEGFVDPGNDIIGNEEEQFLAWADGRDLHLINIQYAIGGNYGSGGVVSSEEISFYKRPLYSDSNPNIEADITKVPGSTPNSKLVNKIFQFAVRLKYYDNTFSTVSSYSEIPVPEENIPSGKVDQNSNYGYISVKFYMDNEVSVVDAYQLLYRIVDIGEGVPGNWIIYTEESYNIKGFKVVNFLNEKSFGVVSDEEVARPYDFVPDIVNHLGIIDSNRVVLDVGEEGFDNVSINPSVVIDQVLIDSADEGLELEDSDTVSDGNPVTFTKAINISDDFYYNLVVDDNTYELYTYNLGGSAVYTELDNWASGLGLTDFIVNRTVSSITFSVTGGSPETYRVSVIILSASPYLRTLKTGASYKFGIVYGYSGKIGSVQTRNNFSILVDDVGDITVTSKANYLLDLKIQMLNSAPTDATDFRFVSFGSDVDYFEEYVVNFNGANLSDSSSSYTMYLDEPFTVIKKDDIINRMRKAYGDEEFGIDYGFDFQVGDIVKFVGLWSLSGSVAALDYDLALQDVPEYRIEVVNATEIKITSSAIRFVDSLAPLSFWMIQIIRKKLVIDQIAQEFSPVFPISSHGNQINVTEYFSDIWKSKQVYINPSNASDYGFTNNPSAFSWMEKTKVSLYYDSRPTSQGKVNVVNEFATQRSDRRIRWGGAFIDEAGVNFLTKVDFDDERELDDRNGVINKIQQIGNVLKVYQERKVTSFYLKTTSSIDADGNSTFVFSDDVMSIGRQSIEDYGCTHFTSYIKNVRNAYFFDIINAAVIRDAANGFEQISDYKMHTYFKNKSRQILESVNTYNIFGGWDEDLEMYLISFVNLDNLSDPINETLGFHEPSNRWLSFYSFLPEYYGTISGDQLISFRGGALYEHNVNATRNNFYAEQFDSEAWLHCNKDAVVNKVFDSIEINSVNQWAAPDDDSIVIERPIAMQSRLLAGKFRRQEGIYRSEFMRDNLNGGSSPTRNNLFNGRQLRGKEITIKLKNSDTDQTLLESVLIRSSVSK